MATTKKKKTKNKAAPKNKEEKVMTAQVEKGTSRAIQQTVVNRELKWLYPKDCTDTLSRKAWRQKARSKIRQLERNLFKLQNSENAGGKETKVQITEYQAKLKKKREEVLADPMVEV